MIPLVGASQLDRRLNELIDKVGTLGLTTAAVLALVLFVVSLRMQRRKLILGYLMLAMLSGATNSFVDSSSTLMRWFLIGCIAVSMSKGWRWPGWPCMMIGTYSVILLASTLWSPFPVLGTQIAVLLFTLTIPAAGSISDDIRKPNDILQIPVFYTWSTVLFVVTVFTTDVNVQGARFSGAMTSAPLFVITGGLLMIALVWDFLRETRKNRRYLVLCGIVIVFTLSLLAGQRTGFFASLLGLLPMLFRSNVKRVSTVWTVIFLAVAAGVIALIFLPEQRAFLDKRFFSTSLTGREEVWTSALKYCFASPIFGYGVHADQIRGFGFHNAFLKEWHNGGIAGLILFSGAFVVMLFQSASLAYRRNVHPEVNDLGFLFLGWTIALVSSAFFESKLSSPSNIQIFTAVLVSILIVATERVAKPVRSRKRVPSPVHRRVNT